MAALKFFQIGKANEEITRLDSELMTAKARITELEAAGGSNVAEITAEAERLSAENATLTENNTKLSTENTTLKTELATAKAGETAAKVELKAEKDGFEAKAQAKVQAHLAGLGQPGKPAVGGKKVEKTGDDEPKGYSRVFAACKEQRLKITGEIE